MRNFMANGAGYTRWILPAILLSSGVAACRGTLPPPTAGPDFQIRQATDALVALRSEEPSLPGFSYGDSLAANSGLAKMSKEDADLLIARLYYDLAQSLSAGSQATDKPALRAVLASPRAVGRLTPAHYAALLEDTRSRMARDAGFRREIQQASTSAGFVWNNGWNDYKCLIDGMPWPMIACRALLLNGEYASF